MIIIIIKVIVLVQLGWSGTYGCGGDHAVDAVDC